MCTVESEIGEGCSLGGDGKGGGVGGEEEKAAI